MTSPKDMINYVKIAWSAENTNKLGIALRLAFLVPVCILGCLFIITSSILAALLAISVVLGARILPGTIKNINEYEDYPIADHFVDVYRTLAPGG